MSTQTTTTTTIQTPKSIAVAYILWFFFGQLGVHRFYLGRIKTGVVQLILGVIGWFLLPVGVGLFLLIPLWIWMIVDLFLIPGMARNSVPATVHQVSHTVVSETPAEIASTSTETPNQEE